MDAELLKDYLKKYSLPQHEPSPVKDDTDWDYIAVVEGYPKYCPTEMDRDTDLDIILTNWLSGKFKTEKARSEGKKRGFSFRFPKPTDVHTNWVTIIDTLNGNKQRRWFF